MAAILAFMSSKSQCRHDNSQKGRDIRLRPAIPQRAVTLDRGGLPQLPSMKPMRQRACGTVSAPSQIHNAAS